MLLTIISMCVVNFQSLLYFKNLKEVHSYFLQEAQSPVRRQFLILQIKKYNKSKTHPFISLVLNVNFNLTHCDEAYSICWLKVTWY